MYRVFWESVYIKEIFVIRLRDILWYIIGKYCKIDLLLILLFVELVLVGIINSKEECRIKCSNYICFLFFL